MFKQFLVALYVLAIDMGYYMIIGLLLVAFFNIVVKKEWIANHLGGDNLWSIIKASILGVPLPLCSCGVIPTGLYLKDQGASSSSSVSFLISTPQTGVDSIVATYGLMGITFAWFRPLAAFLSGIFGGLAVKLFGAEFKNEIKKEDLSCGDDCGSDHDHGHAHDHGHDHAHDHANCDDGACKVSEKVEKPPMASRIKASLNYAFGDFVSDIAFHFIIGLVIAALITVFLPAGLLVEIGLSQGILAMLVMIAVGAPMYICSTSSIPIALSLIAKGLSPGTAFVFLFMGPFTNVASMSILSKKLGIKTTVIYLVSAAISAIGFGYLLDFLIKGFNLPYFGKSDVMAMDMSAGWFKTVIGLSFMALIFYHIIKIFSGKIKNKKGQQSKADAKSLTVGVDGMSCEGCVSTLKTELLNTKGVKACDVSLENKSATVWGDIDVKTVERVIVGKGYTIIKTSV
jgi:uncharacterized protein